MSSLPGNTLALATKSNFFPLNRVFLFLFLFFCIILLLFRAGQLLFKLA